MHSYSLNRTHKSRVAMCLVLIHVKELNDFNCCKTLDKVGKESWVSIT